MGGVNSCKEVDERDDCENDIVIPTSKGNVKGKVKDKRKTIRVEDLDNGQDALLSKYKMLVHCNTDPINRSSIFRDIVSEFNETYNEQIDFNTLYEYYNCKT